MRTFLSTIILCACALCGMQAQTIMKGDKFFDGASVYTVQEVRMGKYVYMTSGQDKEITLEKVVGKTGEYMLRPSRQADEPPFEGAEFGCEVVSMGIDGNEVYAVLNANSDAVSILRPVVKREDFRFKAGPVKDKPYAAEYDRINVKGYAGKRTYPSFEVELRLAQSIEKDSETLKTITWVDDKTDLNFDGIPDLQVFLWYNPVGQVAAQYMAYTWNVAGCYFEEVDGWDDLMNPEVHADTQTVTANYRDDAGNRIIETYAWKEGKLKLIKEETEEL